MVNISALVAEGAVLYLDNNVLDRDCNESFWRINGEGNRTVQRCNLPHRLGAATRFHDLKDSVLRRQQIYSEQLYETIKSGRGHIRTIFPILEEYDAYIRDCSRPYPKYERVRFRRKEACVQGAARRCGERAY